MYPNPQEALPLPSRPDVDQYRKLAKELVKACRSGDPDAIRAWSVRWVTSLAARSPKSDAPHSDREITEAAGRVERFAREKLTSGEDPTARCSLTSAQFVIARAHGFVSWPKFVKHVESVVLTGSSVSAFEAAAHAIVSGDLETVERLLRQHPDLIRARSTREHRAMLLHYVSANGVEGYRQVSPKNIARITEALVEAGADVDADADVYGGGCTTLGLVATSSPPRDAGVQLEVIDVLLRSGARMDLPGIVGNNGALIRGCLANGQPEAASYLVSRGAPLDLVGAAGVGRIDVVQGFFGDDAGGRSRPYRKPSSRRRSPSRAFTARSPQSNSSCARFRSGRGTQEPWSGAYGSARRCLSRTSRGRETAPQPWGTRRRDRQDVGDTAVEVGADGMEQRGTSRRGALLRGRGGVGRGRRERHARPARVGTNPRGSKNARSADPRPDLIDTPPERYDWRPSRRFE